MTCRHPGETKTLQNLRTGRQHDTN